MRRILTFNVDYCFKSKKNDDSDTIKILEINPDSLSRYQIVERLNIYPREKRYQNLRKRAQNQNIEFKVLYNINFETNSEKAKRWGITEKKELQNEHFYPASIEGINKLLTELNLTQKECWVLLLSVYEVNTINSCLYADDSILNIQGFLKQLFSLEGKVTFIGRDQVLDKISNDKYLTTRMLHLSHQPKSLLIINGDDPQQTCNSIFTMLGNDVVFKPLSEYSGIGIHRIRGRTKIIDFITQLSNAKPINESSKLKMDLDIKNKLYNYWESVQSNSPFILCQKYAESDMDGNQQITYRAVLTVYVDKNNTIDTDIECIYPKKSDPNDFKSKTYNTITQQQLAESSKNLFMKNSLLVATQSYVKNVLNYSDTDFISILLQGTEVEFLKGIELYTNQSSQTNLSQTQSEKVNNIIQRLLVYSPQSFMNAYHILSTIGKINNISLLHSKLFINYSLNEISHTVFSYFFTISTYERSHLLNEKFSDKEILLFFILSCKKFIQITKNLTYSSDAILKSKQIYNLILEIKEKANILLKEKNNALKLMVMINLYQIRVIMSKVSNASTKLFKLDYKENNYLLKTIATLCYDDILNLASDTLVRLIIEINGAIKWDGFNKFIAIANSSLSDLLLFLSETLCNRYVFFDQKLIRQDNRQVIFILSSRWFNIYTKPELNISICLTEWQLRSRLPELLQCKNINEIYQFLSQYLINNEDETSLCKVLDLISFMDAICENIICLSVNELVSQIESTTQHLNNKNILQNSIKTTSKKIVELLSKKNEQKNFFVMKT